MIRLILTFIVIILISCVAFWAFLAINYAVSRPDEVRSIIQQKPLPTLTLTPTKKN